MPFSIILVEAKHVKRRQKVCVKHFKQVCCTSVDKKGTLDVKKHLMQDRHVHRRHLYYSTAPQTNTLCNLTVIVQSALSYQALKFEFNVSQSENLHLYCHRVAIFSLKLFSALVTTSDCTLTGLVLLFSLAEVVAEVEVAGRFGDWWGRVWNRDIFQVQEAELDFHREENL